MLITNWDQICSGLHDFLEWVSYKASTKFGSYEWILVYIVMVPYKCSSELSPCINCSCIVTFQWTRLWVPLNPLYCNNTSWSGKEIGPYSFLWPVFIHTCLTNSASQCWLTIVLKLFLCSCKNYIVNVLQKIQLLLYYVALYKYVSCVMCLSGHIDICRSITTLGKSDSINR